MSKEIQKLGYCATCDENVPHRQVKSTGLQVLVSDLLQKLQLGRWHCLQCQSTRYFLPLVNRDTIDYRVDQPSDPVGPTNAVRAQSVGGEGQNQQLILGSVHEDLMPEFSRNPLGEDSVDTIGWHQEDVLCGEFEDDLFCEEKENGSFSASAPDSTNDENLIAPEVSLVGGDAGHVVSGKSQKNASGKAQEFVVAEPVGNFIKDKSLVVNATRLKRFTEKYRDALVDRILSGKAQISWLIADGKCTEAELVSWIADKAKRESTDENETFDLDAVARKRD